VRGLILVIFSFVALCCAAQQDDYQLRLEAGVKGDIIKKMDWVASFNARFNQYGLEQFFPEVGIHYKIKKWIKPSFSYRAIVEKNDYGNYKTEHRLNFNINLKKPIERYVVGARIRYQYAFEGGASQAEYDADFDQAFRFKPFVLYDINNFPLSPKVSAEFFYNPQYGPTGPGFTKIRAAAGAALELDGAHDVSFKYLFDKWLFDYSRGIRHAFQVSYQYRL
jgi:hypothetical protein